MRIIESIQNTLIDEGINDTFGEIRSILGSKPIDVIALSELLGDAHREAPLQYKDAVVPHVISTLSRIPGVKAFKPMAQFWFIAIQNIDNEDALRGDVYVATSMTTSQEYAASSLKGLVDAMKADMVMRPRVSNNRASVYASPVDGSDSTTAITWDNLTRPSRYASFDHEFKIQRLYSGRNMTREEIAWIEKNAIRHS